MLLQQNKTRVKETQHSLVKVMSGDILHLVAYSLYYLIIKVTNRNENYHKRTYPCAASYTSV